MYSYAGKVDIGVYEESNDDRVLIGSHILTSGEFCDRTDDPYIIAAICDGVGGMAQGYRAAMTSLECFSHLDRDGVTEEEIRQTVELANKRVRLLQNAENLQNGLRTTVAGIYAGSNGAFVFNAGDSRVYRLRYRFFTQLSKDHSPVQDMIDLGELSKDEAKSHPQKHMINKCIGHEEVVNPRVIDISDDLMEGDLFMICSDGISDEVTDAELKEIILNTEGGDLPEACRRIRDKAVEKGSRDNMSVILLKKEV